MTERRAPPSHRWCSLRVRFDDRELALLRAAERVRGAALAHQPRPQGLRSALALAKAGHKLRSAGAGVSLSFDQTELQLLVEALRFAHAEIRQAAGADAHADEQRRATVLQAFPELVERGLWRSFGLLRELEQLSQRLEAALRSM